MTTPTPSPSKSNSSTSHKNPQSPSSSDATSDKNPHWSWLFERKMSQEDGSMAEMLAAAETVKEALAKAKQQLEAREKSSAAQLEQLKNELVAVKHDNVHNNNNNNNNKHKDLTQQQQTRQPTNTTATTTNTTA